MPKNLWGHVILAMVFSKNFSGGHVRTVPERMCANLKSVVALEGLKLFTFNGQKSVSWYARAMAQVVTELYVAQLARSCRCAQWILEMSLLLFYDIRQSYSHSNVRTSYLTDQQFITITDSPKGMGTGGQMIPQKFTWRVKHCILTPQIFLERNISW